MQNGYPQTDASLRGSYQTVWTHPAAGADAGTAPVAPPLRAYTNSTHTKAQAVALMQEHDLEVNPAISLVELPA